MQNARSDPMFFTACLLAVLVACGPKTAPEAPEQDTTADQVGPVAFEETLDLKDPEDLARRVFKALVKRDADAYVALTVSTVEDFEAVSELTGSSRVPTEEQLEDLGKKHKELFGKFLAQLDDRGVDLEGASIANIDTSRAHVKDGLGFAEDIKLTIAWDGHELCITIDDCILTARGWLIMDGLKLRDQPEKKKEGGGAGQTTVTAVLGSGIEKGKNLVYCATFQLAWNALRDDVVKEDVRLADEPALVGMLNKSPVSGKDVSPESYVAMAGLAGDNIVGKINEKLKEKFKEQAPEVNVAFETQEDILAYAYLLKNLEFKTMFEKLKAPVSFLSGGESTEVTAFGITQYFPSKHKNIGKQVRIVDYNGHNDFIITLKSLSKDDEIVLAKVSPRETLEDTVKSVLGRMKKSKPKTMKKEDVLMIPIVELGVTQSYKELIGKHLENEGYENHFIGEAMQKIDFRLNEKGALLKSEAIILVKMNGDPVKEMIFNKPFLILLKLKKSKNPYLAVWVGNPEFMTKM